MGLFTLFKLQKPPTKLVVAADLTPCLAGETVLQLGAADLLPAIRQLVSSPENIYQKLYGATLARFAEFCQTMPTTEKAAAYSLLRQQVSQAIAALKIRRGWLLPPSAGAETIAAQEPLWTYALFSASLLVGLHPMQSDRSVSRYNAQAEYVGAWALSAGTLYEPQAYFKLQWQPPTVTVLSNSVFIAVLAARIILPPVISWLSPILTDWWEALVGENPANPITAIIAKVQSQMVYAATQKAPAAQEQAQPMTPDLKPLAALLHFMEEQSAPCSEAQLPHWLRVERGLLITQECLQHFLNVHKDQWQQESNFIAAIQSAVIIENDQHLHAFRPRAFEDRRILTGILIAEKALPATWQQQPINTIFQPAIAL